MHDNPYLDTEAYELSLAELDPVTREQLRNGNWDILAEGNMFKRHWFKIVQDWPRDGKAVRFWDFAATEAKAGVEPDWLVGIKVVEKAGQFWIANIKRDRLSPKGVEDLVSQTAQLDGRDVPIWLEQEPGSSGKIVMDDYQRRVLKGFTVHVNKPSTNKPERAKPVSSAAEAGNVFLVDGPWVEDFLEEVAPFPGGEYDDQVDCLSGAHTALTSHGVLSITRL
jgi:predicted phage terminase large subunit-like protein